MERKTESQRYQLADNGYAERISPSSKWFIVKIETAEEIVSVLPNVTLKDIIRKPIEANHLDQIIQTAILSKQ